MMTDLERLARAVHEAPDGVIAGAIPLKVIRWLNN